MPQFTRIVSSPGLPGGDSDDEMDAESKERKKEKLKPKTKKICGLELKSQTTFWNIGAIFLIVLLVNAG